MQHQRKLVPDFTVRYSIDRPVYYRVLGEILAAITREKQIKSLGRMEEIGSIESVNRDW